MEEFLEIIDKADDEKPDIDQRLAEPAEEQEGRLRFWLLPPVPPALPIPIWRPRGLRKQPKPEAVLSRWRQEVPAVLKMC